jgi:hypothetical protein
MATPQPDVNEETRSPPAAVAAARGLLKPPVRPAGSIWSVFAAAALFAGSALALAFAVIWGPPHL